MLLGSYEGVLATIVLPTHTLDSRAPPLKVTDGEANGSTRLDTEIIPSNRFAKRQSNSSEDGNRIYTSIVFIETSENERVFVGADHR